MIPEGNFKTLYPDNMTLSLYPTCIHQFSFWLSVQRQYNEVQATAVRANATHVAMNDDDDSGTSM